jgi:oligoendopeptidase F
MHCFDGLSQLVEKDVKDLILRRNHVAQEMGYEHFGDLGLMLQGLSRTQLSDWFSSIIQKTESIYQSFLSEAAERLNQTSLYPQDLSYAVTQFKSLPDEYFSSNKLSKSIHWLADHIMLTEALARVRIDFVDIPFQGLCVTIHVPDDIRILINPSNGQSYYSTFFHEIGHAMHSSFITQPYHLFRDEPGPFCEGMAETMARFVDDPYWLLNWANLPEEIAKQNKSISQAEFEWRMYAEPEADLLNVFQTIKGDYLKVPSSETLAWADNSYWTSYPFYVQNYVIAEMIASQTHLALRKFFGQSIQASSGAWLAQNYWNSGGSIEWSEKILQATGATLSADELILELTRGYPPE